MNDKIMVNGILYELIVNYKYGFEMDEFISKCTDYFWNYDYIIGDIAYGKLRLKGFYDSSNSKVSRINNYDNKDKYLSDYCASDCKYFIVKKVN